MVTDEIFDDFGRVSGPVVGPVVIPPGTGFLSKTPELAPLVRQRGIPEVWLLCRTPLADVPANIVPRQVTHAKRPHRKTEPLDGGIDLGRAGSLVQHEKSLSQVLHDHPVADESIAHSRDHRGFS